jgi:hypothetical protein
MSKVPATHNALLDALRCLAGGNDSNERISERVRAALLAFGSETPDNVSCTDRIEVGHVDDIRGLKLRNQNILLSELACELEDAPVPQTVKAAFPDITGEDWSAFVRLTTLLYISLEPS